MPSWDELYADPTLMPIPDVPEPFVVRALEPLATGGRTAVLDVGCGAGRHLAWLERSGFAGHGMDSAPHGLAHARARLAREALPLRVALADMHALPFASGRFGAVIAYHVLYHGLREEVGRALDEVARVLRTGGTFVGSLLSTRAWKFGEGDRLEPLTYVQARGPEAGVPHHYCDEEEARALLAGFDVDRLELDEHTEDDGHRHSHWRFVARRRPA
jgi:SAM-dependent methyltransferase